MPRNVVHAMSLIGDALTHLRAAIQEMDADHRYIQRENAQLWARVHELEDAHHERVRAIEASCVETHAEVSAGTDGHAEGEGVDQIDRGCGDVL